MKTFFNMLPLLTVVITVLINADAWPRKEDIYPCTFKNFPLYKILECKALKNPDDLVKPVQATAGYTEAITKLRIINSVLKYIPKTTFNNTKFEEIHFVDSDILFLSDGDLAFQGLESHLKIIGGTNSRKDATLKGFHWRWNQLRELQVLDQIEFHQIQTGAISEPFPELKKLSFLSFHSADISFVAKNAFRALTSLSFVRLRNNHIDNLERNMFPEPANRLTILDFSDNKLSNLPADFFTDMSSLRNVYLDRNKFITFDSKVFSEALGTLDSLYMEGNAFRCDCHLLWMVAARYPRMFKANCANPENVFGKPLMDLKQHHLNC